MLTAKPETATPTANALDPNASGLRRRFESDALTRRHSELWNAKANVESTSPNQRSRGGKKLNPKESDRAGRLRRTQPQRSRHPARHTPQVTYDAPFIGATDEWKFPVEKAFVYFGYVVASAVATVFGLDLLTGIPFIRASILFDVSYVLCALLLGYICWNAHRDLR